MDTTRMACPNCGTPNAMLAVLNDTRHYRCASCGETYYTPDSCLAKPDGKGAGQAPADPAHQEPRRRR